MRFSVDAHAIGCRLTGNEVYVRNLLEGLACIDCEADLIAYVGCQEASKVISDGFRTRCVSPNPLLRLGFDLPRQILRDRPNVLHVQYTAPLICPVPVVATVHDVGFLERPEFYPAARRMQLRATVRRTVAQAARVITGSEFSREAIVRAYPWAAKKTVTIPDAASRTFRPLRRDAARRYVRSRFGVPAPYLLSVGDLQPRKNQAGLIRAFVEMLRAYPHLPHRLVLAGKGGWRAEEVRNAARDSAMPERIHFTGFASDEDLLQLYNACEFSVFPSHYEGFGLPVIEAMACGRAVACSGTTSLPEAAGGAAILFDPCSIQSMFRALRDLVIDTGLRATLEHLGLERAAKLSWRETAAKTLAVYYDAARSSERTHIEPWPIPALHRLDQAQRQRLP